MTNRYFIKKIDHRFVIIDIKNNIIDYFISSYDAELICNKLNMESKQ